MFFIDIDTILPNKALTKHLYNAYEHPFYPLAKGNLSLCNKDIKSLSSLELQKVKNSEVLDAKE